MKDIPNFIKVGEEGQEKYINVNHIAAITYPSGGPKLLKYEVVLVSGDRFTFYDNKGGVNVYNYMPREQLLQKIKDKMEVVVDD